MKPIAVGSPRLAQAEEFGRELTKAMRRRGVGRRPLAAATGMGASSIMAYKRGANLPTHANVIRLAESLNWPHLITLSRSYREGVCPIDGNAFINESTTARVYCGAACVKVAAKMRLGRPPVRITAAIFERQASRYRAAVEAFCNACEPDGICRTIDCPLRPVSPLKYQERREAAIALPVPNITPASIAKIVEANHRRWAEYTPEERAARIESVRAGRWGEATA